MRRESQDDTQASDLKTWTNVNPFAEAAKVLQEEQSQLVGSTPL